MNILVLVFFLAGPVMFAIGNFILGPLFNKQVPMKIHFRSFMVGTTIYVLLAAIAYQLFLKNQF